MRTDLFCHLIVAILAVLPTLGRAENKRPCDTAELGYVQCGKYQRCRQFTNADNQMSSVCECQRNYHLVNDKCVPSSSTVTTLKPEQKSESGSSVAAGLLIPTFLIIVGVLLYFGARRYKWVQRFRQYRHNRYGNVLVTRDDDDDDDPPIA